MQRLSVFSLCLPPQGGVSPPPLAGPLDPDSLLRQASSLSAFPAVYQNLRERGVVLDPDWDDRFRHNYIHNSALQQEESRLLAALRRAGLACCAIKGVGLVELLYPDLSWRAVADIDLLARPDQVEPAYFVLKDLGLRDAAGLPWNPASLARQVAQPDYAFAELVLLSPLGAIIELHWDWPGEAFPAGNPALDSEPFLLYLCRHAGKHFWSSLQNLCDLELYLRRVGDQFDWGRFWRLARRHGWERVCAAGFEVCANLFERPLRPGERQASSRAARRLSRRAAGMLLSGTKPWWWRSKPLRLLRAYTWRQRLGRVLRWLAPPPWHWNQSGTRSAIGVWLRRYRRLGFRMLARLVPSRRWRIRLEKAGELSGRDWLCLVRALWTLSVVRLALPVVSFDRLQRWAGTVRATPEVSTPDPPRTAWLVNVAANLHPAPMRCLARSLTLARLLARRGIATELKLGVRLEGENLLAHAWVEWQGRPLNDAHGVVPQYAELSRP